LLLMTMMMMTDDADAELMLLMVAADMQTVLSRSSARRLSTRILTPNSFVNSRLRSTCYAIYCVLKASKSLVKVSSICLCVAGYSKH